MLGHVLLSSFMALYFGSLVAASPLSMVFDEHELLIVCYGEDLFGISSSNVWRTSLKPGRRMMTSNSQGPVIGK